MKKATRACDQCRQRKIKCRYDALQTHNIVCLTCTKTQQLCTFERQQMKRGPSKGLRRRAASLPLAKAAPPPPPPPAPANALGGAGTAPPTALAKLLDTYYEFVHVNFPLVPMARSVLTTHVLPATTPPARAAFETALATLLRAARSPTTTTTTLPALAAHLAAIDTACISHRPPACHDTVLIATSVLATAYTSVYLGRPFNRVLPAALSMAHDLGLHRAHIAAQSSLAVVLQSRLYVLFATLDRFHSLLNGTPPLVRETEQHPFQAQPLDAAFLLDDAPATAAAVARAMAASRDNCLPPGAAGCLPAACLRLLLLRDRLAELALTGAALPERTLELEFGRAVSVFLESMLQTLVLALRTNPCNGISEQRRPVVGGGVERAASQSGFLYRKLLGLAPDARPAARPDATDTAVAPGATAVSVVTGVAEVTRGTVTPLWHSTILMINHTFPPTRRLPEVLLEVLLHGTGACRRAVVELSQAVNHAEQISNLLPTLTRQVLPRHSGSAGADPAADAATDAAGVRSGTPLLEVCRQTAAALATGPYEMAETSLHAGQSSPYAGQASQNEPA